MTAESVASEEKLFLAFAGLCDYIFWHLFSDSGVALKQRRVVYFYFYYLSLSLPQSTRCNGLMRDDSRYDQEKQMYGHLS